MGVAGFDGHLRFTDVAGFDAEHVGPFVIAEIGHGFGFGDPGVPDDGGVGVLFGDGDFSLFEGIVDGGGGGGVEVDAVGFGGDGDVAVLYFFLGAVHFVEIANTIEACDGERLDVADAEIGVEGFLRGQRGGAGVGEFER